MFEQFLEEVQANRLRNQKGALSLQELKKEIELIREKRSAKKRLTAKPEFKYQRNK